MSENTWWRGMQCRFGFHEWDGPVSEEDSPPQCRHCYAWHRRARTNKHVSYLVNDGLEWYEQAGKQEARADALEAKNVRMRKVIRKVVREPIYRGAEVRSVLCSEIKRWDEEVGEDG